MELIGDKDNHRKWAHWLLLFDKPYLSVSIVYSCDWYEWGLGFRTTRLHGWFLEFFLLPISLRVVYTDYRTDQESEWYGWKEGDPEVLK